MSAANRTPHRVKYLADWRNKSYEVSKEQAFQILGKKCSLCGFDDVRALVFDHLNGGGTRERKRTDSASIMRRVVAEPHEFRVLCWNCNWISYIERKVAAKSEVGHTPITYLRTVEMTGPQGEKNGNRTCSA